MNTPIFTIHVEMDFNNCPHMEMPDGMVTIIPFWGNVEGEIFNGKVMPGAADVQVTNAAGVRHMCAKYMLEGTDNMGEPCHIYIENNGYFMRNTDPMPFEACPTIRTDSPSLRDYLQGMHFRAEGHPSKLGVDIKIFDTEKDLEA